MCVLDGVSITSMPNHGTTVAHRLPNERPKAHEKMLAFVHTQLWETGQPGVLRPGWRLPPTYTLPEAAQIGSLPGVL